jgi:beta-glucosidase
MTMPQASFHFPAGFLWGTATAAHQVEGSNTNNNWAYWETQPGRIFEGQTAGLACDWWSGRWKEDFDRAAEAGQNAHRLSVEWSRIQPTPDHWDEDALDYYRQIIRGLNQRGMTPVVTLHHFTDPIWLMERGGWENPDTIKLFATFCGRVAEALKEYVTLWVPINEPIVYTYSGFVEAAFPPGKHDMNTAFNVLQNMVRGHAAAYSTLHEVQRVARVGTAHHYRGFYPAHPSSPLDAFAANLLFRNWNDSFMGALFDGRFRFGLKRSRIPEAVGTQDFVGLNYYTADLVSLAFDPANNFTRRVFPPEAQLSENGFIANYPRGLGDAIRWARKFDRPMMITENGVEDSADKLRPTYLLQHVHQIWKAVNQNAPIKGYFHWSLVDNFEWERGWSQRFGLWGLDVPTQARIRRPSVDLYAAICKENGITSEMVEKFAPAIFPQMFPG